MMNGWMDGWMDGLVDGLTKWSVEQVKQAGSVSNSAVQDKFCYGTDCVVTQIYDQSPNQNHLPIFNYPKRHPKGACTDHLRCSRARETHG